MSYVTFSEKDVEKEGKTTFYLVVVVGGEINQQGNEVENSGK